MNAVYMATWLPGCDSCACSPQGDVLAQSSFVLSVSQTERQVGDKSLNHSGI